MCQNCFNTSNSPTTTTITNTNTNTNTSTTTTTTKNASSSTTTTTVATVLMNKMLKVHHRSSASSFRSAITTEVSSEDVVAMAAAADRVRSEGFNFGFGSEVKRKVNQCFGCRRKVGLTGFQCRCGKLFFAEHQYTDRHVCSYDYKATGCEAIARINPVIKATKIVEILVCNAEKFICFQLSIPISII
ncbi:hypothetical protein SO802_011755 [Lithocarpus litseifolius]|uniref:AN1-type domain-containing protein n=1 Tax=Lithocarpus litseifolius TaxID=425828 RepID=A0AAW2D3I9_9ROSI